ncbi:MAG TPA: rod shape-determining protein RodA [Acidobacteriota bacterium]|nr:rod shape-determining protein RodA [Acidobacteriota bacterium]
MTERRLIFRLDYLLAALAVFLGLAGVVLINSATHSRPLEGLWLKQLFVLAVGTFAMLIVGLVNYRFILRFATPIYIIVLGMLVFLAVFGRAAGGARSWFDFSGLNLQPSEFAKIALILILAKVFASIERSYLTLADMWKPLLVAAVPMALTAAQPDLGTAITMVPLLMGVAIVAGLRFRAVVALLLIGLILFTFAWMFVLKDYQKDRLRSFLNPDDDPTHSGYQIKQSLIAIGSGGLAGKGLFLGSQSQLSFVPAQHTDFIFSVLSEELGFVAVVGILMLFAAFFARALLPLRDVHDVAGIYIVVGAVSFLAFQAVINILMSIGMFPTTGVPLPFLSYGGSSLLSSMIAVGLIISVYAHRSEK